MSIVYIGAWALLGILSIRSITSPEGLFGFIVFLASTAITCIFLTRGSTPFTLEGEIFFASRWSRNNLMFPTQVAIQPTQVIRHKGKPIGAEEESINMTQVASVRIETGWLWSNVIIESTGGANSIICHGHMNADAQQMKDMIQHYQEELFTHRHHPRERSVDRSTTESTVTLALVIPASSPMKDSVTLQTLTCHLPSRQEEVDLETAIEALLAEGPDECSVHITREHDQPSTPDGRGRRQRPRRAHPPENSLNLPPHTREV